MSGPRIVLPPRLPAIVTAPPPADAPPGPTGRLEFTFTAPTLVWSLPHNLGRHPAVTLLTTGGVEMLAQVLHLSRNVAQVQFDVPTAGTAVLS